MQLIVYTHIKTLNEILNLAFWGRRLVMKRFGFHSNSRGTVEILDFQISMDFQKEKHGVVIPV